MDVDTRLLRYFAAVADEGNLTRAAQRLFVSQPALTKQIRQLEAQLGVTLFTRSRAGMALTDAGRMLAEHSPNLVSAWDTALRETRSADSRAARVLRVGFVASAANEHTQDIIAAFARRRPGWRVDMRQTEWSDPTAGLADGHVDAALLRLPFPRQDAFHVETLLTEPRSRSTIYGTNRSSPPQPTPAGGATTGWPPTNATTTRCASARPRTTPTNGSRPSPTATASASPRKPPPASTNALA
jgi:DNA-binding transcriptional LysR family regulator